MHPLLNILGFFIFVGTAITFVVFVIKFLIYLVTKRRFPQKSFATVVIGMALFSGIYLYLQYGFTFDAINQEHRQEGTTATSPSKTYTARVFYEPYGGAAGGVNVWVEVTNNEERTTKIIYYADAKNEVQLAWVNEDTLSITNADNHGNRNKALHVEKEIYHESGLACQSLRMKKDYDTCYEHESDK